MDFRLQIVTDTLVSFTLCLFSLSDRKNKMPNSKTIENLWARKLKFLSHITMSKVSNQANFDNDRIAGSKSAAEKAYFWQGFFPFLVLLAISQWLFHRFEPAMSQKISFYCKHVA